MKKATFQAMDDAMGQNRVTVITHPKRTSRAVIVAKYPKDGAGRLQVWCADYFVSGAADVQYSTAGGYGYDKMTAALSGFTIDGHRITDHCAEDDTSKRLLKAWHAAKDGEGRQKVENKARKAGYSFTNWSAGGGFQPEGKDGWQSCYHAPGLEYLSALGYNVFSVG